MQRVAQGQVVRLEHAAGTRITVHRGQVWLTESGNPDDVFLCAGQYRIVRGPGRVIIEPHGDDATVDIAQVPRRVPSFGVPRLLNRLFRAHRA